MEGKDEKEYFDDYNHGILSFESYSDSCNCICSGSDDE